MTVFPDAGATVVSARVDGVDVGTITNDAFSFAGSGLSSGFHTLSVTTENASSVQTVTQQEFLVVGSSNTGSEMFEFQSTKVGDVVTVEAYVKNLHAGISDGIRSYDFWIDLDESKFDYVGGALHQRPARQMQDKKIRQMVKFLPMATSRPLDGI